MFAKNVLFFALMLLFTHSLIDSAESPKHHPYVPEKTWSRIVPYLMPEDHPLKAKLDRLFSKKRVLKNIKSLVKAGFQRAKPQPRTGVIVTRHREMPGYIFKLYTDDTKKYYRDEPEYITWMLRARGAKLVRNKIEKKGWQQYFKAPQKWIYTLPLKPKADKGDLQKNFILVEEDMDILSNSSSKKKWFDGTVTKKHLKMLFHIVNSIGLRGGCKYDNIPFCKDGRIAFIDTQNNLKWPLPYQRLFRVLRPDLKLYWESLFLKN